MSGTARFFSAAGDSRAVSGLVFFRTANRDRVVEWYTETVGASVWLEQPGCTILEYEGFRFGFCDADDGETETEGIVTFVTDDRAGVDAFHERVGDAAREEPHVNEPYEIYQFFADDPDGRTAEFQTFLHETPD